MSKLIHFQQNMGIGRIFKSVPRSSLTLLSDIEGALKNELGCANDFLSALLNSL